MRFVIANDVLPVRQFGQLESTWRRDGHLDVRVKHPEHDVLSGYRLRYGEHYGLDRPAELFVGLEFRGLQRTCGLQR